MRRFVEKVGIDVEKFLDMFLRVVVVEFIIYYYYIVMRNYVIGFEGEIIKEIVEDVCFEDRNYFEVFVLRIYEFGGEFLRDIVNFLKMVWCCDVYFFEELMIENVLKVFFEVERCVVGVYIEICNYIFDKDLRIYDLVLVIFYEEIEYEVWFEEFLIGKLSGYFRRSKFGESFYVFKFLR